MGEGTPDVNDVETPEQTLCKAAVSAATGALFGAAARAVAARTVLP